MERMRREDAMPNRRRSDGRIRGKTRPPSAAPRRKGVKTGKMQIYLSSDIPAKMIPLASPLRFTNHSDMYEIHTQ
jgi:hypothetical protein